MVIEVTFDTTDVYISTTVSPVYVNVSFEAPSGGGAAVWGSITGTLSDQTDLQTALDAKVPYTGATQDVSLGEYGINVGNVIYDTTPTGIPTDQGATYWDDQAETVALVMNGTIQKIGEDTFYHVKNSTGSTIAKGVAVRFAGSDGASGKILIAPFLANGTYPSQYYMGITAEAITNGSDGKVYHFGKIRGVNTSAFADGDILYCNTTVAGGFQTTAPSAPNNIVIAAAVINAGNNGTLMVRTTTGSNINTDEGVLLTTPTSGQVLKYNGSLWVNDSVSGALGYTPANSATTLTINGVTYDLSTSRTWTISAGISGSGASGQVAYWTGASSQSGSNNLFWDNANGRLGIGISTPTSPLHITATSILSTREQIIRASVSDDSDSSFIISNGSAGNNLFAPSFGGYCNSGSVYSLNFAGFTTAANDAADSPLNFGLVHFIAARTTTPLDPYNGTLTAPAARRLFTFGNITNNGILTIYATTNVGINSTTDSGQRLQVQGTTLLNGNVTFSSATGMTWDAANSRLGIGLNNPAQKLDILGTDVSIIKIKTSTNTGAAILQAFNDVNSSASFGIFGSTRTPVGTINSGDGYMFAANDIAISSNGNVKFGNSTNERMRIFSSTGNVLIQNGGTFTDSGERLQVTGTMKVTDNITLSANSTSFKGFTAINSSSASVATLEVKNNLSTTGYFRAYGSTFGTSTYSELADIVGFGSTKSIKIFADANVTSGGTNSIQFMAGGFNDDQERVRIGTYGILIGTKTSVASAILTIVSTTKGFLPPRMTTTQKNAISSPAAGLVVYDTTLAKLCVYTTAWETITSI